MATPAPLPEVPVEKLRWRLDPASLPFESTAELAPLKEIIGQQRALEAFRFGIKMNKPGYNIFVTGAAGSGRMSTVKKLLEEMVADDHVPEDLCYVNAFKNPERPVLLRLKGGTGAALRESVHGLVETLRKQIPQLFESQEYISSKKEVMETYERKANGFLKGLDQKVREEGFSMVNIQMGQIRRPELMPIVDGNPMPIEQLEAMVEKGRFPKAEYEELQAKYTALRGQIDQIFLEVRDLQKEVQEKLEQMDRATFMKTAADFAAPIVERFNQEAIRTYLDEMLNDMAANLKIFEPQPQGQAAGMLAFMPEVDHFQPYQVNLLVDNSDQQGPPVVIEAYPTYRNIFGSIERVVDRTGVWRTDFSKIKAGSLLKANGGALVFNLLDAIVEPGVWQSLKRALKSEKLEIQTYDPFYLFTTTSLKPEAIALDVKVVLISDAYLYQLLLTYDEDLPKIFKVRADFDTAMPKTDDSIRQFAEFVRMVGDEEQLTPFDRSAVGALVEQAVRMTGRQEKISTSFPAIRDLIREADFWAAQDTAQIVQDRHVDRAIEARIYRANRVEEHIQEMIDRGTLMIDVSGEFVGQVNGLAVYALGDHIFGKPSRITATTAMGRAGIINIEREADMSGSTHNKGVLILSGYLREKFAQEKPLSVSASIAFEQSYHGVDGDSASSTEIYALLSSLAEAPIRQDIAVTGSVNQKGEIQPIGGVNQKIEGFFDCCRSRGLTGAQGVMIPESNVKDLMLRKDVLAAVSEGRFHVYAVSTIDQGIEILTGRPAGAKQADGTYPEESINGRVDRKLAQLAEGLKGFGDGGDKGERGREQGAGRQTDSACRESGA